MISLHPCTSTLHNSSAAATLAALASLSAATLTTVLQSCQKHVGRSICAYSDAAMSMLASMLKRILTAACCRHWTVDCSFDFILYCTTVNVSCNNATGHHSRSLLLSSACWPHSTSYLSLLLASHHAILCLSQGTVL